MNPCNTYKHFNYVIVFVIYHHTVWRETLALLEFGEIDD